MDIHKKAAIAFQPRTPENGHVMLAMLILNLYIYCITIYDSYKYNFLKFGV